MKKIVVSVLFLLLVFSLSASALTVQAEQETVLVPAGTVIYDNLLAVDILLFLQTTKSVLYQHQ